MKSTVNHEIRIRLAEELGINAAAAKLGIQPQTIRLSLKKKDLYPPKEESVITRITVEADDSRFYHHKNKINPRTGNNFFPSYSFLHTLGAPASPHLADYYKNRGWDADRHFKNREMVGSAVHNYIDDMIKWGKKITQEEIRKSYPNDWIEIQKCLLGAMNFFAKYKPIILSSEFTIIGDDFGGTVDMKVRVNEDNYESVWLLDWKTAKTMTESHKMQVAAYNTVVKADNIGIVVVGNQTKQKFTFSKVSSKDQQELLQEWEAIKNVAYIKLLRDNWIEPRVREYPDVFCLESFTMPVLSE